MAAEFDLAREAVMAIRQARSEYDVPPGRTVGAVVVGANPGARRVLHEESALIGQLARAQVESGPEQAAGDGATNEAAAHALLSDGSQVTVPLAGAVDLERECARLGGDLERLEKQLAGLGERLANEKFTTRAKPEVVEAERRKYEEWTARREQLRGKVKALCGA